MSRLTHQKGFDLVNYVMEEMLSTMNVQFVILGTGEYKFEESFTYFNNKYPDRVSTNIGYSEELAHEIYAGCDAFLMPSLFEPCGLSQMISMRYGTIPIVRETGGLKDTVINYDESANTGTGFTFSEFNAHEMMNAIKIAESVFRNKQADWKAMIRRAMEEDFSWDLSAKKYEELYDKIIK